MSIITDVYLVSLQSAYLTVEYSGFDWGYSMDEGGQLELLVPCGAVTQVAVNGVVYPPQRLVHSCYRMHTQQVSLGPRSMRVLLDPSDLPPIDLRLRICAVIALPHCDTPEPRCILLKGVHSFLPVPTFLLKHALSQVLRFKVRAHLSQAVDELLALEAAHPIGLSSLSMRLEDGTSEVELEAQDSFQTVQATVKHFRAEVSGYNQDVDMTQLVAVEPVPKKEPSHTPTQLTTDIKLSRSYFFEGCVHTLPRGFFLLLSPYLCRIQLSSFETYYLQFDTAFIDSFRVLLEELGSALKLALSATRQRPTLVFLPCSSNDDVISTNACLSAKEQFVVSVDYHLRGHDLFHMAVHIASRLFAALLLVWLQDEVWGVKGLGTGLYDFMCMVTLHQYTGLIRTFLHQSPLYIDVHKRLFGEPPSHQALFLPESDIMHDILSIQQENLVSTSGIEGLLTSFSQVQSVMATGLPNKLLSFAIRLASYSLGLILPSDYIPDGAAANNHNVIVDTMERYLFSGLLGLPMDVLGDVKKNPKILAVLQRTLIFYPNTGGVQTSAGSSLAYLAYTALLFDERKENIVPALTAVIRPPLTFSTDGDALYLFGRTWQLFAPMILQQFVDISNIPDPTIHSLLIERNKALRNNTYPHLNGYLTHYNVQDETGESFFHFIPKHIQTTKVTFQARVTESMSAIGYPLRELVSTGKVFTLVQAQKESKQGSALDWKLLSPLTSSATPPLLLQGLSPNILGTHHLHRFTLRNAVSLVQEQRRLSLAMLGQREGVYACPVILMELFALVLSKAEDSNFNTITSYPIAYPLTNRVFSTFRPDCTMSIYEPLLVLLGSTTSVFEIVNALNTSALALIHFFNCSVYQHIREGSVSVTATEIARAFIKTRGLFCNLSMFFLTIPRVVLVLRSIVINDQMTVPLEIRRAAALYLHALGDRCWLTEYLGVVIKVARTSKDIRLIRFSVELITTLLPVFTCSDLALYQIMRFGTGLVVDEPQYGGYIPQKTRFLSDLLVASAPFQMTPVEKKCLDGRQTSDERARMRVCLCDVPGRRLSTLCRDTDACYCALKTSVLLRRERERLLDFMLNTETLIQTPEDLLYVVRGLFVYGTTRMRLYDEDMMALISATLGLITKSLKRLAPSDRCIQAQIGLQSVAYLMTLIVYRGPEERLWSLCDDAIQLVNKALEVKGIDKVSSIITLLQSLVRILVSEEVQNPSLQAGIIDILGMILSDNNVVTSFSPAHTMYADAVTGFSLSDVKWPIRRPTRRGLTHLEWIVVVMPYIIPSQSLYGCYSGNPYYEAIPRLFCCMEPNCPACFFGDCSCSSVSALTFFSQPIETCHDTTSWTLSLGQALLSMSKPSSMLFRSLFLLPNYEKAYQAILEALCDASQTTYALSQERKLLAEYSILQRSGLDGAFEHTWQALERASKICLTERAKSIGPCFIVIAYDDVCIAVQPLGRMPDGSNTDKKPCQL
ncbi:hypothetical protein GMRT_11958 [Giardia muris]|uniref:Uncharacterized protein n=1 Tax=Giardia muris TaxID=5742 RepID=A0A4Z1SWH4_GIAMU|nr:hypothetical protein GMRT_11958 [Giardia muris]|eukprot:TNJ29215.1 hypothetical protein GMRT_11958 [Giardia muris]